MPWLDTLGLAGETAADIAEAAAVGAAPFEAIPIAGAALAGGAVLGGYNLYRRYRRRPMTQIRQRPWATPARRNVRRRLPFTTPRRFTPRTVSNVRTGGYQGKELKFVDQFHNTTIPKTVASSLVNPTTNNNLAAIATGSGQSARIGRHVHVKGIYIQGHLNIPIAPRS